VIFLNGSNGFIEFNIQLRVTYIIKESHPPLGKATRTCEFPRGENEASGGWGTPRAHGCYAITTAR